MDARKQALLIVALVSVGLAAIAILVLAVMFEEYLLIAGEVTAGVAFIRYGALPIAEKLIELNGAIQRQRIERQEMLYRVLPDARGVYPQLYDVRERRAIYYPSANARALPSPRPERYIESQIEEPEIEEEQEQPRRTQERYDLSEFLARGLDMRARESLLGFTREGEPVAGPLFDIDHNFYNSVFVAGETGFGKSALGVLNAGYTVAHEGYLLAIDPDAEYEQSLTERLGSLKNFLLCDVADTPAKAKRVVQIARAELEKPSAYPVLWLIDEFSTIARQVKNGGAWQEVGKELLMLLEEYTTRGRKRRRRAIVFGQYTQASRSGGTEVRDTMTQAIFHLKKRQASLIFEKEEAREVMTLREGEIHVIPARSSQDSFTLQLLYPDEKAIEQIVQERLSRVPEAVAPTNIRALAPAGPARDPAPLVLSLREKGVTQEEIIYRVWAVKKGGSERYARALQEYRAIISQTEQDNQEIIYGG